MKAIPSSERRDGPPFSAIHRQRLLVSPLLINLLRDTSTPILVYLAEQHGLRRVPGLTRQALVDRILRQLSEEALRRLEDELIAARYGSLSVSDLLKLALEGDKQRHGRAPRLEDMPTDAARLIEGDARHWVYTMHGYDVIIDLERRHLACSCPFFQFASRRQALCKHLARAFTLVPEVYAREALIDLLVSRGYGGPDTPGWSFDTPKAA